MVAIAASPRPEWHHEALCIGRGNKQDILSTFQYNVLIPMEGAGAGVMVDVR